MSEALRSLLSTANHKKFCPVKNGRAEDDDSSQPQPGVLASWEQSFALAEWALHTALGRRRPCRRLREAAARGPAGTPRARPSSAPGTPGTRAAGAARPWRKCGCGSAAGGGRGASRASRASGARRRRGLRGAGAMGRLHCTQDAVPEAVGVDMQQLNQLGAQQFSALTEVLFHFLTEPKEVERFLAQLSEFAATNQISLGPLRGIVKSLLLVPNGALKRSLTAEQVRADFMTLGLSEEKATYFSEKWKQNAPGLAQWAMGQTLMINQLIDMEWKFGVTSGSSELEKVGSIFLQLKLVVKKGNQTESVYLELTLPQFYSFLHEMQRARASMESLS